MNKKVFLVSIIISLLTIILSANSQALYSCDNNQTIILLSGTSNAHASTSLTSGYSTRICFNEIFENNYLGANPNQCTGTNKVVRISGTTNAHLEDPTQTTQGYTDVCFGNLVCTPRTLQNCQNYEQLVMKLYSATNSHGLVSQGTSAPINICCRTTTNVTSGPHWENFAGQEITSTSVGSTVRLIVSGIDLDKVLINYTIQKKTTFWLVFTT